MLSRTAPSATPSGPIYDDEEAQSLLRQALAASDMAMRVKPGDGSPHEPPDPDEEPGGGRVGSALLAPIIPRMPCS
jgi:hypothetical protein